MRQQTSLETDEVPLAERSGGEEDLEQAKPALRSYTEKPKTAYTTSRWSALQYGSIHILPVLATITILSFNFTDMYWNDLGAPNQNVILDLLQYAAKIHEILIQFSLAAVVIQRIQLLLISSKGVPLGLVTAGYRLIQVGYLFSEEFWSSITTPRRSNRAGWGFLGVLIGLATIIIALAGPSSAVVMIPQLDWWPVKHPYLFSKETCYLNMTGSNIWPSTLPSSASFDPTDQYSVVAGYDYIGDWVSSNMNQGSASNITVNSDSGGFRYLSAVSMTQHGANSSLSGASTVSQRQARDLGSFWQFLQNTELGPEKISRPIVMPRFADSNVTMMKPLVQVECTMTNLTESTRNLEFPHYQLLSQDTSGEFQDLSWPVPDLFTNWTAFGTTLNDRGIHSFASYLNESSIGVNASFVNVSDFTNAPSAAAVFIVLDEDFNPQIVPCSVVAYWSPVSIWINPHVDTAVYQDSPNASAIFHRQDFRDRSQFPRITIPDTWTDMLNAVADPEDLGLKTNDTISPLQSVAQRWGYGKVAPDGSSHRVTAGHWIIPGHFAITLSLYMAEALARVNYFEGASWVFHDPNNDKQPSLLMLDDLNLGNQSQDYQAVLSSRSAPRLTEFTFEFQRYGYAWSFRTVTVRLAAAVLLLQALLAIGHLALLLWTGWSSNSWKSPGELVALALRKDTSTTLRNAGAGIERKETWRGTIYARTAELDPDAVELVIDEHEGVVIGTRLKAGKKYQ